jgi:lysophospholipase L1-like esterase
MMIGHNGGPRVLVTEGDSITSSVVGYAVNYPATASPPVVFTNRAVSGSCIDAGSPDLAERASVDDALKQGGLNILSVLIGANDLGIYNLSAATYETAFTTWLNARVAAGWIVVVQTITASDPTQHASLEASRGAANTWIKAQEGVLYDYLVDYTPTIMDLQATAQNLTYYASDGIHPTAAGHSILLGTFGPVINAITGAKVRTPIIALAAGSYTADQTTTITTTTSGASIYYTLDGSTPTQSSTLYTGAVTISASETLTAKAFKSGCVASNTASAAYTLTAATPTFSPAPGSYSATQSVTLSCATAGVSIYYTTDGSTPTTGSTLYTGAISVAASETIKALAVKAGITNSSVASGAYSIVTFITATGGTITTDGNYKVHTLVNGNTFTITSGSGSVDYLMAGGGGGGGTVMGGGGSGGEVITGTDTLSAGSYAATVGAGGVGSSTRNTPGADGTDTTWNSHTARKGRGGGSFNSGVGTAGVNGGGSGYNASVGGTGSNHSGGAAVYGGGGGAGQGADGQAAFFTTGSHAGNGGDGISNSITGTATYYGGGGSGGGASGGGFTVAAGTGGQGGGATGATGHTKSPNGTDGKGGGGGGGGYDGADGAGGDGGKGTVIVRYQFQ